MYEAYLDNPGPFPQLARVSTLQHVPATDGECQDVAHAPVIESFRRTRQKRGARISPSDQCRRTGAVRAAGPRPVADRRLPFARRALGRPRPAASAGSAQIPELEPFYDLSESDMDITFSATNTYFTTAEQQTLREICRRCVKPLLRHHRRRVYRRPVGALVAAEARVDPQQAETSRRNIGSTSSTA